MPSTAIIGLDGLSPADVESFDVPGDWDRLRVETTAHTCPSWNAIFSGQDRDGVYDFFALPDDADSRQGELAAASDEMWDYDDLLTGDYLWERFDVTVVDLSLPTPADGDSVPWDVATRRAFITGYEPSNRCERILSALGIEY